MTPSQREPGINKKRSIIFRRANDPQGTVQSLFKSSGKKEKYPGNGTTDPRGSGSTWATHSHSSIANSDVPESPASSTPASPTSSSGKGKLGFLGKKASFASLKRATSEPAIVQV